MQKPFDLVVMIGRFQPFHNGHQHVLTQAFATGENVAVLVGSCNRPASTKNPFSFETRELFIRESNEDNESNLFIDRLDDYREDYKWVAGVEDAITAACEWFDLDQDESRIAIIGHFKDASSYYLAMFPDYEFISADQKETINATDVRNYLFSKGADGLQGIVPEAVYCELDYYEGTVGYDELALEHDAIRKDKLAKSSYPYQLNEVCVDAVVIHPSNKILVVRRGGSVGNGLLALPGGFLNTDETLYEGSVRELIEETCIDIGGHGTKMNLCRCYKTVGVFDSPGRSTRGRIITHAHLFKLDTPYLPVVKGADDAQAAFWLPLDRVNPADFHDDHAFIIGAMIKHL